MAITRYVTGDTEGVITLTANAVDPNGNPISQQITISINPTPQVPKCYNSVLALSPVQDSVESACAQFGVASTYYLGTPRNTIYSTSTCSDIVSDGFYKTEDGSWVSVSGGVIRQRGTCAAVNIGGPRRGFEQQNISTPIATTRFTDAVRAFVPEPTFTPPSPTTAKPDPAFIAERAAAKIAQRLAQVPEQQPILTQTTTQVEFVQPTVTETQPVRQRIASTPIVIPAKVTQRTTPSIDLSMTNDGTNQTL